MVVSRLKGFMEIKRMLCMISFFDVFFFFSPFYDITNATMNTNRTYHLVRECRDVCIMQGSCASGMYAYSPVIEGYDCASLR